MKKILLTAVILFLVIMLMPASLLAEETAHQSVAEIVAKIEQEQGVTKANEIDISKVGNETLEELGDSVMEEIIGNPVMHEHMDDRLGGEGSTSLVNFHIQLAKRYLSGYPLNRMSLMGSGMMNRYSTQNERTGFGMMGYGWMGLGWLWMLLIGLVAAAFIALLVILLIRQSHITSHHANTMPEMKRDSFANALEILAERYAKGEISDEQYARMKSEIKK